MLKGMDFATLLQQVSPGIRRMVEKYKNWVSFIDTDDLYQEVCIYLWHNFKAGVPEGINAAYIINGCRFHILNYLRKNKDGVEMFSLEEPLGSDSGTFADILPQTAEGLDRCVDRKLTFEEMQNNGLSKREKETLGYLRQGLTVREAAAEMGISHVMVLKYKQRLIRKWQRKKGYQKD